MSKSAKDFEEFARDCVRLAEQADTPALREKLLGLAREWMQALMDVEDREDRQVAGRVRGTHLPLLRCNPRRIVTRGPGVSTTRDP